jgi:SAM-dependent methyltransferase
VADLPFALPSPLADQLRVVADIEAKIPRVLAEIGQFGAGDGDGDGDVALLDVPLGALHDRLAALAPSVRDLALPLSSTPSSPLRLDAPDGSLDVLIALWSAFHGVDAGELAEVDRVLRPGGRLLVVHDYGRDDVSALADPGAPAYGAWSRRDGPFLARGGFRLRVVHCFWTFTTIEAAQAFLAEAFGAVGEAAGARLKRPRLSWNVAIYHRYRGGVVPATLPER